MSRLRQDPLTGRWVIIAAGRGARPNEFPLQVRAVDGAATCPFCPGHESETTPEVLALGRAPGQPANGPGWRLRVFPNMYPAVRPDEPPDPGAAAGADAELCPADPGRGRHEVVVYSPDHAASLADLAPEALSELFTVVRDRMRVFAAEPGVRFVAPFCNHGPEAGATLAHPHLQIIGAGRVPLLTVEKTLRFAAHRRRRGSCLLCDLAAAERAGGPRLVAADEHWTVVTPWASRFPWEMLLIPMRHAPGLAAADAPELASFGRLLRRALRGLQRLHGDLSLNVVVHDAPADVDGDLGDERLADLDAPAADLFHWHVEILPRLSRQAGFEAGTGYAINAVEPETAARLLRDAGEDA